MKKLLILFLTLGTAFALSRQGIKSRNVVVPAGRPMGRIVEGKYAAEGELKYQVALALLKGKKTTMCGGSLLNHEWVLTAAHCTEYATLVRIVLGTTHRLFPEITHVVSDDNIIMHENYNTTTIENDIALIKIPYTNYSDNIQPVQLPAIGGNDIHVGENVVISGWGRIGNLPEQGTNKLKLAYMNVISNEECKTKFEPIFPTNICTEKINNAGSCKGDSGGPVLLESRKIQIGIISYSTKDCYGNKPLVGTRTASYLEWIQARMRNAATSNNSNK